MLYVVVGGVRYLPCSPPSWLAIPLMPILVFEYISLSSQFHFPSHLAIPSPSLISQFQPHPRSRTTSLTQMKTKVEMQGGELAVEIEPATAADEDNENGLPFQDKDPDEDEEEREEEQVMDGPARVTYIDYLKSPIIGLLVGQGDEQALLTAHQGLLTSSPWFADACAKLSDEVSVRGFPLSLASGYEGRQCLLSESQSPFENRPTQGRETSTADWQSRRDVLI